MSARALVLVALLLAVSPSSARADDALWALLKAGGQIVVVRHATAPGTFDPPGMRLDDCATQRNLDEQGRAEARRMGDAFRARGIPIGDIRSSQWCRCMETARLAFGRVEPWAPLNGAMPSSERERLQTEEVRAFASTPFTGPNVILITHNFNVRALTGISPGSAEMVVLTPTGKDFTIAGRMKPDAFVTNP